MWPLAYHLVEKRSSELNSIFFYFLIKPFYFKLFLHYNWVNPTFLGSIFIFTVIDRSNFLQENTSFNLDLSESCG